MRKFIFNFTVLCIPILLVFSLYSHMCSTRVLELHNSVKNVNGVNNSNNYERMLMYVPFEPIVELISVSSLFNSMLSVTEDYGIDNSYNIFKDMEDTYKEVVDRNGSSLFTNSYNNVVKDMISYFKNYSTFDKDSTVTENSKISLHNSINNLKIVVTLKIILFIFLFMTSICGFVYLRLRFNNNL